MSRRGGHLVNTLIVALVVAVVGAAPAGARSQPTPGAPRGLTVDDDAAPLAVAGVPRFGWFVTDNTRGAQQTGYRILVGRSATLVPNGRDVLWDSGDVRSAQHAYVGYSGPALARGARYWWTVRTSNASGAGPFAPPSRFDTALADADWHADWVRRPGFQPAPFAEDYAVFRHDFDVASSPVVRAIVYASAGQQYELHVNGRRVAHGPSFAYPDEQYYETTDITNLLRAGKRNAIGFITHWYADGQGRPFSAPGLIARVVVEHANGARQVLTTDRAWQVTEGPWTEPAPLRNDEGDHVEHIDGRVLSPRWDTPGFTAPSWSAPDVIGPHPTAPFTHLRPQATHIVEQRVKPVSVRRLASGAYVADFGSVIAAVPWVTFRGGRAGRSIAMRVGYLLDPDGQVSTTRGVQETNLSFTYIERSGTQLFVPFTYLAFRYLQIDDPGAALRPNDVAVLARHSEMPDENAATFSSSVPGLDAIFALARHSALYDAQEQFLDTPTREKGQFLTDSSNVSSATMAAFGERNLTRQALLDFASSQRRYWPGGQVNAVYPNGDGKRDIPDYTEMYPQWVWNAYLQSGDTTLLRTLLPAVENVGAYIRRSIDARTGLVTNLPGGGGDYAFGMVDWPPQMRYGYDMKTAARTVLNELAVGTFTDIANSATAAGAPAADVQRWRSLATNLSAAINAKLVRRDGTYIDGLRADGTQSAHASQQANAFALSYGVVPVARRAVVGAYVAKLGMATGPMNAVNVLDGLHVAGRGDALVQLLTNAKQPGWARIIAEGGTFTWESWDARQTGDSESHGWGANVLAALQRDVLGVRVTAPGARRIDVDPPPPAITHVQGTVPTPSGPVKVNWTRSGTKLALAIIVPVGVTATVHWPTGNVTLGAGRSTLPAHGQANSAAPPAASARPSHSRSDALALVGGAVALAVLGVVAFADTKRRKRRTGV